MNKKISIILIILAMFFAFSVQSYAVSVKINSPTEKINDTDIDYNLLTKNGLTLKIGSEHQIVEFAGHDWYAIGYDKTSNDLTLFAKDGWQDKDVRMGNGFNPAGTEYLQVGNAPEKQYFFGNNDYYNSYIRAWLNYYAGEEEYGSSREYFTALERSYMKPIILDQVGEGNISGTGIGKGYVQPTEPLDKLFLLSYDEADSLKTLNIEVMKNDLINMGSNNYRLRSPANSSIVGFYVTLTGGIASGTGVYTHMACRPALILNLDSCIFKSSGDSGYNSISGNYELTLKDVGAPVITTNVVGQNLTLTLTDPGYEVSGIAGYYMSEDPTKPNNGDFITSLTTNAIEVSNNQWEIREGGNLVAEYTTNINGNIVEYIKYMTMQKGIYYIYAIDVNGNMSIVCTLNVGVLDDVKINENQNTIITKNSINLKVGSENQLVEFAGHDWYAIGYDENTEYLTLFAKDNWQNYDSNIKHYFSDSINLTTGPVIGSFTFNNSYYKSYIRAALKYFETNISYFTVTEQEMMQVILLDQVGEGSVVITGKGLDYPQSADKLFLLSLDETYYQLKSLNNKIYRANKEDLGKSNYWTRTPVVSTTTTGYVSSTHTNTIHNSGSNATGAAIRPGIIIDISDATFTTSGESRDKTLVIKDGGGPTVSTSVNSGTINITLTDAGEGFSGVKGYSISGTDANVPDIASFNTICNNEGTASITVDITKPKGVYYIYGIDYAGNISARTEVNVEVIGTVKINTVKQDIKSYERIELIEGVETTIGAQFTPETVGDELTIKVGSYDQLIEFAGMNWYSVGYDKINNTLTLLSMESMQKQDNRMEYIFNPRHTNIEGFTSKNVGGIMGEYPYNDDYYNSYIRAWLKYFTTNLFSNEEQAVMVPIYLNQVSEGTIYVNGRTGFDYVRPMDKLFCLSGSEIINLITLNKDIAKGNSSYLNLPNYWGRSSYNYNKVVKYTVNANGGTTIRDVDYGGAACRPALVLDLNFCVFATSGVSGGNRIVIKDIEPPVISVVTSQEFDIDNEKEVEITINQVGLGATGIKGYYISTEPNMPSYSQFVDITNFIEAGATQKVDGEGNLIPNEYEIFQMRTRWVEVLGEIVEEQYKYRLAEYTLNDEGNISQYIMRVDKTRGVYYIYAIDNLNRISEQYSLNIGILDNIAINTNSFTKNNVVVNSCSANISESIVGYAGYDWYAIGYNQEDNTVTLLSKDSFDLAHTKFQAFFNPVVARSLDVGEGTITFNGNNEYYNSYMRAWLKYFEESEFSRLELESAIPVFLNKVGEGKVSGIGTGYRYKQPVDRLFLLSYDEANALKIINSDIMKADNTSLDKTQYWLRTPSSVTTHLRGVNSLGDLVNLTLNDINTACRPAMVVNLNDTYLKYVGDKPVLTANAPAAPGFTKTPSSEWTKGNVLVELNEASIVNSAPTKYSEYSFEDTGWIRYKDPISVNAEGVTKIYGRTVDVLDNRSLVSSVDVNIDNEAPRIVFERDTEDIVAKEHSIKVQVIDDASGFNSSVTAKYLWTTSKTTIPSVAEFTAGENFIGNILYIKTPTPSAEELSGKAYVSYYLWVRSEDKVGNITTECSELECKVHPEAVSIVIETIATYTVVKGTPFKIVAPVVFGDEVTGIIDNTTGLDTGGTWMSCVDSMSGNEYQNVMKIYRMRNNANQMIKEYSEIVSKSTGFTEIGKKIVYIEEIGKYIVFNVVDKPVDTIIEV